MVRSRFYLGLGVLALASLAGAAPTFAESLLSENFGTNPIGSRATITADGTDAAPRFSYAAGAMTAHYQTQQSNTKLIFPLAHALNQATAFTYSATFSTNAASFYADPNGFAQISFGLINHLTTGNDRTDFGVSAANKAYDLAMVDYFPNISPFFETPSVGVTVMQSHRILAGNDVDMFDHYGFPTTKEAGLQDEGDLPRSSLATPHSLTANVSYVPSSHTLTLRILDNGTPLNIDTVGNALTAGGYDADPTTIQTILDPAAVFSVDSFALTLWNDPYSDTNPANPSVRADVAFTNIEVSVPEPASLGLLAACGLFFPLRRRRH